MRERQQAPNPFLAIIGAFSFFVDVVLIAQFIGTRCDVRFWSIQWFISLGAILIFFLTAVGFMEACGIAEGELLAASGFGLAFLSGGLVALWVFCFRQCNDGLPFADYVGHMVLVLFFAACGLLVLAGKPAILRQISAFGFGLTGLVMVFCVFEKYVVLDTPFTWTIFVGELALITLSLFFFFALVAAKDEKKSGQENK